MPKDVKFNIKLTIDGKEQIVTASTNLKKFSEELEIARSESHNHQGLCVHRLAGIWRSSLLFCRVRHLRKTGPGFGKSKPGPVITTRHIVFLLPAFWKESPEDRFFVAFMRRRFPSECQEFVKE